jgi:hypothetical protein
MSSRLQKQQNFLDNNIKHYYALMVARSSGCRFSAVRAASGGQKMERIFCKNVGDSLHTAKE